MEEMGLVPPPFGSFGHEHYDLWEVIHGGGSVSAAIRRGDMGLNSPHPANVG